MLFSFNVFCAVVNCFPTQSPVQVTKLITNEDFQDDFFNTPIVWTPLGGLEGFMMKTIRGRSIAAFQGIPYAQPPIGHLRFRKPVPVQPWEGLRKATKPGNDCLQIDITKYFLVHGSEDCLSLSVYTPQLSGKKGGNSQLLPVIMLIPGGGNLSGTGNAFGPAYLLDKDVILVTVSHRIGILGFLSTGDDASPGSNGLKDLYLALKWISSNIEAFSGDPKRVTILGQSSAAALAGLLMISPKSSHLLHGGIIQSGSPFCHWALNNQTISRSTKIAQSLGCPTGVGKTHEMVNCLREQNAQILVGRQIIFWKIMAVSHILLGPVIEDPSEESFLEESPEVSYARKNVRKIPMLTGVVESEGTIFAAGIYLIPFLLKEINRRMEELLPFVFVYDVNERTNDLKEITSQIREFYFDNHPLGFHNIRNFSQALGDRTITQGTYYGMQHHSQIAPTYAYYFDFQGKYSFMNSLGLNPADWGVSHLDDMIYIFNSSSLYQPVKAKDYDEFTMSEFLTNMWTNFAKTGKPLYTDENGQVSEFWEPIRNPLDVKVLEISRVPKMIPFPPRRRIDFWSNLHLRDDHYFASQTHLGL